MAVLSSGAAVFNPHTPPSRSINVTVLTVISLLQTCTEQTLKPLTVCYSMVFKSPALFSVHLKQPSCSVSRGKQGTRLLWCSPPPQTHTLPGHFNWPTQCRAVPCRAVPCTGQQEVSTRLSPKSATARPSASPTNPLPPSASPTNPLPPSQAMSLRSSLILFSHGCLDLPSFNFLNFPATNGSISCLPHPRNLLVATSQSRFH
jgi:hypothetical protein